MYNWEYDLNEPRGPRYFNLIMVGSAAGLSILLFLIFHPQIEALNQESPLLINVLFGPALAIGFLYGIRITEKAVKPSEIRSPIKRSIAKIFLFFFVIGGMFSAVGFALNGGSIMPSLSLLDEGLIPWLSELFQQNGSATFLIVSSISIMAAATKRIVGLGGVINRIFTFVGTFVFFSMIAFSLTNSDPTHSEVYLYTFYQAGIVGGAFYQMNKLTKNLNTWEDFSNGYL